MRAGTVVAAATESQARTLSPRPVLLPRLMPLARALSCGLLSPARARLHPEGTEPRGGAARAVPPPGS